LPPVERAVAGGGGALPPPAGRAAATGEAGVKALVASAERKARDLPGPLRVRVEELAGQLKRAVARADAGEARRLEEELTNLLFELG
jgi:hypothetical protein